MIWSTVHYFNYSIIGFYIYLLKFSVNYRSRILNLSYFITVPGVCLSNFNICLERLNFNICLERSNFNICLERLNFNICLERLERLNFNICLERLNFNICLECLNFNICLERLYKTNNLCIGK